MGPGYEAILGTHVHNECKCKSFIKWGKREKPRGKKPPPKREMKEDAWMDGVIKTPHYDIHPIYTKEKDERKRDRIGSPPTEEC